MKAARITKPGTIQIVDADDPRPGSNDVVIRVCASGICGTDVHIYRGEYLGDYPVIPGHEAAGTVESVGGAVTRVNPGDRVAMEPNISCDKCESCLNNRQNFCAEWQGIGVTRSGSMAQYVVAPEKNVFGIGSLSFAAGSFVEPLSCVLHGIQKAGIRPADHVLVLGAGPIGCLLLQCARIMGAAGVHAAERIPARADLARSFGAAAVYPDLDEVEKERFDVVIDATGAIPVLERAIDFVRYGGTMLFFGVAPSGEPMRIEPFRIFRKGLTIVSSYTSRRNSYQAIDLLTSGSIRTEDLVSHTLALEELERGIRLVESGEESVRKVLIEP